LRGPETNDYFLLDNGVKFHELDYDALQAAVVGKSKRLLLPRLNVVCRCRSYLALVLVCRVTVRGVIANATGDIAAIHPEQDEIKRLFETAIHAALAEPSGLHIGGQFHHNEILLGRSSLILSYIGFLC
jgi:hypothetical protein